MNDRSCVSTVGGLFHIRHLVYNVFEIYYKMTLPSKAAATGVRQTPRSALELDS